MYEYDKSGPQNIENKWHVVSNPSMFLRKWPIFWRLNFKSLGGFNVRILHWIDAKFSMQLDKLHVSECGKFQDQQSTDVSAVVLQRYEKTEKIAQKCNISEF